MRVAATIFAALVTIGFYVAFMLTAPEWARYAILTFVWGLLTVQWGRD